VSHRPGAWLLRPPVMSWVRPLCRAARARSHVSFLEGDAVDLMIGGAWHPRYHGVDGTIRARARARRRSPARRLLRSATAGARAGERNLLPPAILHGGHSSDVLGRSRPGSLLAVSARGARSV